MDIEGRHTDDVGQKWLSDRRLQTYKYEVLSWSGWLSDGKGFLVDATRALRCG